MSNGGAAERMESNIERVASYQQKWHPHQNVVPPTKETALPFRAAGKFVPIEQDKDSRIDLKTRLIQDSRITGTDSKGAPVFSPQATGATPFGIATLQESELDWVERKKSLARAVDDYRIFTTMYDLNDPAELMIAKQVCPQYWKALEEQLDFDIQLLKKLEELAIHGLQSWEDFQLTSALFRGEIDMPSFVLYNKPVTGDVNKYQIGLFNPRKVMNLPDAMTNPELVNLASFLWRDKFWNAADGSKKGSSPYKPTSGLATPDNRALGIIEQGKYWTS
jgi:hypothetical protein